MAAGPPTRMKISDGAAGTATSEPSGLTEFGLVGRFSPLLASGSLLLRTLWNLENVPLGMRSENVLVANLAAGNQLFGMPAKQFALLRNLEDTLRLDRRIQAFAFSDSLPPNPPLFSAPMFRIEVEGRG